MVHSDAGVRLMETLLNVYAAGLLADHASEVADETMHVTVAIVQRLLRCGLLGELLERLCPVEGEAPNVSASQITLLRVLAACLDERLTACQGARTSNRMSSLDLRHIMQKSQRYTQSTLPLLPLFCTLASYAASVMKQHVDHGDVRDFRGLVRAHMALLAVMQCLHLAGMCAQEDIVHRETSGDTELLARMRAPESGVVDACVGTYADCFDIVLALMHEANRFFPAQSPFQPGREEARRTMQAGGQDTTARPVSPGASVHSRHASDTGIHTARASDEERTPSPKARRVSLCTSDAPAKNDTGDGAPGSDLGRSATGKRHPVADDRPALHRLKCSALQLLGTLAFEPSGAPHLPEVRALQNRVREQGGLLDTLSLTQVDKHNPCTLRSLLLTPRYPRVRHLYVALPARWERGLAGAGRCTAPGIAGAHADHRGHTDRQWHGLDAIDTNGTYDTNPPSNQNNPRRLVARPRASAQPRSAPQVRASGWAPCPVCCRRPNGAALHRSATHASAAAHGPCPPA